MQIFNTAREMHAWSVKQKQNGKKIGLVPTMGALHDGHLALLNEAKKYADSIVLSIYVNPTQFGPKEDLAKYPRDLDSDLEKAKKHRTDAVFFPSNEVMYPKNYQTFITVEDVTKNLCGASRPGHFRGVATVVAKLFNIVAPDVAVFGQKDFQQLVVIRRMVEDLNFSIKIVGHPTIREADGLAMSSRNKYLSKEERKNALSIFHSLKEAQKMVEAGEQNAAAIIKKVVCAIESADLRIDYVKLVNAETMTDLKTFKRPALLAIAAFAGKTRLIDNLFFPAIVSH